MPTNGGRVTMFVLHNHIMDISITPTAHNSIKQKVTQESSCVICSWTIFSITLNYMFYWIICCTYHIFYTSILLAYHLLRAEMLCHRLCLGPYKVFANIVANISYPAHFRIREYSQEYRWPDRLFLKNIEPFVSPLTLVDLDYLNILKYSRRYHRGVYNLLARASQNSSFAPQQ